MTDHDAMAAITTVLDRFFRREINETTAVYRIARINAARKEPK